MLIFDSTIPFQSKYLKSQPLAPRNNNKYIWTPQPTARLPDPLHPLEQSLHLRVELLMRPVQPRLARNVNPRARSAQRVQRPRQSLRVVQRRHDVGADDHVVRRAEVILLDAPPKHAAGYGAPGSRSVARSGRRRHRGRRVGIPDDVVVFEAAFPTEIPTDVILHQSLQFWQIRDHNVAFGGLGDHESSESGAGAEFHDPRRGGGRSSGRIIIAVADNCSIPLLLVGDDVLPQYEPRIPAESALAQTLSLFDYQSPSVDIAACVGNIAKVHVLDVDVLQVVVVPLMSQVRIVIEYLFVGRWQDANLVFHHLLLCNNVVERCHIVTGKK
mmetsp:Transcript_2362/g.4723  ORF Transcript_2362/g.4723 Transcript_2362/m.4723 type:complete len:328 (+) Transcript_2362:11-994(+)